MTRREVLEKAMRGEITWIEAAEICRISPRQMRRIRERYKAKGLDGLIDLRMARKSPRRTADGTRDRILDLYRNVYRDFSVTHFFEKLQAEHKVQGVSYTTVLRILKDHGLVMKGEKRSPHRKRRERRPMRGMMIHMDGSTHDWFQIGNNVDLVVNLDDADSKVLSGRFTHQESTRSCMEVLKESVTKYGVFCSLYTDKAMHFVITNSKGKLNRSHISQIERALHRLGTELIIAHSPQARGRMERMWRTWQGRLPQELKLRGIKTIEEANRYLNEEFIPWHNENLTVEPTDSESTAFVRPHSSQDLDLIFSVQTERQVNSDNTIQFRNRIIQIPRHPILKGSFAGTAVTLNEHLDGRWTITQGQHVLARFDREFNLIESQPIKKAA